MAVAILDRSSAMKGTPSLSDCKHSLPVSDIFKWFLPFFLVVYEWRIWCYVWLGDVIICLWWQLLPGLFMPSVMIMTLRRTHFSVGFTSQL